MYRARVLRIAARHSLAEFFAIYPPALYIGAWLPRLALQVAFFAWFARFVGGEGLLRYTVVGSAVQITAQATLSLGTISVAWEQRAGTVPLLVAAPTNPLLVLIGRNLAMGGQGLISGAVMLYLGGIAVGIVLSPKIVIASLAILTLVAGATYGLAMVLGSLALRARGSHNVASSFVSLSMLLLCGVIVPVQALPEPAQFIGNLLPLTHGLAAIRDVLANNVGSGTWVNIALELLVGIGYLAVGQLSLARLVFGARLRGTLDFH